jgi:urease gamma subunit
MIQQLKYILSTLLIYSSLFAQTPDEINNRKNDSLTCIAADAYALRKNIDIKALRFTNETKLPIVMEAQIAEQKRRFERYKLNESEDSSYTPQQMLEKIDTDKEYAHIFAAEYWMAYNYQVMIPELINRLTNKTEVGLVNTADLIIGERIESGDLKFYGHGGVAFDDLYTIAGRASHLLKRVTGMDLGSVSMYSTPADLKKLQNRWGYWLLLLQKAK